jgi:hypothetical protein
MYAMTYPDECLRPARTIRKKDTLVGLIDEPAVEAGARLRKYVLVAVVVAALLIGAVAFGGFLGRGPVIGSVITQTSDVPQRGQVWFGTAVDPESFLITNRATTFKSGASIAAVAHLTTSIGDGEADWRLLRNDQLFRNGLLRVSGTGDFFSATVPTIEDEGRYEYDIVDLGGTVIASGDFVVAND